MNTGRWFGLVVLMGIIMGLNGCSTQEGRRRAIDKQIALIHAEPVPPVEAIPSFKAWSIEGYTAHDIHSPFDRPQAMEGNGQPDQHRLKEELEAYPLDALKMVGILRKGHLPWVLIRAPNGMVYHLTRGNYLGQNYGKIIDITDQQLILMETVPDGAGGWKKRNVDINMVSGGQSN